MINQRFNHVLNIEIGNEISLKTLTKEFIENMNDISASQKERLVQMAFDALSEVEAEQLSKTEANN